ncbi:sigma factor-like helix-turn-helix DNA-binding protein [Clavibacter michiganensis]|nr:sigma factor-like helix-turn-helix DNA-binding protein [Clavibacter michiganensis]
MTDNARQPAPRTEERASAYATEADARLEGADVESALNDPRSIDPGSYGALAEAILSDLSSFVFRDVFPRLPDDLLLSVDRLPVRAQTVLGRAGATRWGDLADLRVSELMVMRGMGAKTIADILVHIIRLSAEDRSGSAGGEAAVALPVRTRRERGAHAPLSASSRLLEAVELLAAWATATGTADMPLLPASSRQDRDGVPVEVREARVWLHGVTADAWLDGRDRVSISDRLHFHLGSLEDRERTILLARIDSPSKRTLEALGLEHGVTRERIRQIEARVMRSMRSWLHDDADLAFAAAGVRHRMGPLAHRDSLSTISGLGDLLDGTTVTALQFLDAMDDGFSGDASGWYGVPSLAAARDTTGLLFADLSGPHGESWHEDVEAAMRSWAGLSDTDLEAWLDLEGYVRILDIWVGPERRSIPDRVAAVLSEAGVPSSLEDLHGALGGQRSLGSVRNALAADARFQRVGRDRWGLAEWGGDAYTGIKEAIATAVRAGGGGVLLDDISRDLPPRLAVSANSVRTFASGWPFEVRGGVVGFAEKRAVTRKDPYLTRRLYLLDETVALRLTVTNEHLRGSGMPVSAGTARALGISPGDVRTWPGGSWDMTLSWSHAQPHLSSIRLALVAIDAALGDDVMITWGGDTVSVRALVIDGSAEAMLGDHSLTLPEIAGALGLPPAASWSEVAARAEARGEHDLAEACVREAARAGDGPD